MTEKIYDLTSFTRRWAALHPMPAAATRDLQRQKNGLQADFGAAENRRRAGRSRWAWRHGPA